MNVHGLSRSSIFSLIFGKNVLPLWKEQHEQHLPVWRYVLLGCWRVSMETAGLDVAVWLPKTWYRGLVLWHLSSLPKNRQERRISKGSPLQWSILLNYSRVANMEWENKISDSESLTRWPIRIFHKLFTIYKSGNIGNIVDIKKANEVCQIYGYTKLALMPILSVLYICEKCEKMHVSESNVLASPLVLSAIKL